MTAEIHPLVISSFNLMILMDCFKILTLFIIFKIDLDLLGVECLHNKNKFDSHKIKLQIQSAILMYYEGGEGLNSSLAIQGK